MKPEFQKLAKRSIAIKNMHTKLTTGKSNVLKTGWLSKKSDKDIIKEVFRKFGD